MKRKWISVVLLMLLLGGCGKDAPAPGGDVILLAHYDRANNYLSPVVEAVAAVEGRSAETDASGVQRVRLDLPEKTVTLVDYQSHDQIMTRLSDSSTPPVAAVLVVMGTHGMMQDQHEQLRQARAAGVPVVTVLQSQTHMIDDLELLDLVEMEVESALEQAGYPGDLPVDRASAVRAVEGDQAARNDISRFIATLRQRLLTIAPQG